MSLPTSAANLKKSGYTRDHISHGPSNKESHGVNPTTLMHRLVNNQSQTTTDRITRIHRMLKAVLFVEMPMFRRWCDCPHNFHINFESDRSLNAVDFRRKYAEFEWFMAAETAVFDEWNTDSILAHCWTLFRRANSGWLFRVGMINPSHATVIYDTLFNNENGCYYKRGCLLCFGIWEAWCCNLATDSSILQLDFFELIQTKKRRKFLRQQSKKKSFTPSVSILVSGLLISKLNFDAATVSSFSNLAKSWTAD